MKIAVLGIGFMGAPMARRLCQAGHEVHVWNRTKAKADPLADFGAQVHLQASDAVAQADAVVCVLESGEVVAHVLFDLGVATALRSGATVVDLSSIKPEQARDHAARLSEIGISHLDAPVSGGTLGAESGTLAIMVGGKAADFERMRPLLEVFGRATHVGPHGCGQLAKLANQMIVGVTIGAVAEALLLCKKGGASMAKVKEAITGGFADSRILQVHGQRMVEHNFNAHARLSIQLKDLRNALATANEIGFEAPITTLFESLYAQAAEHGLTDLDHSALFLELASRNGIS
ncbi:MAG: NAD(P)-dependent oxidoreductase [Rhodoferax sp.]|nr:NAD(P)-dependent oxidoreductase [Rhodoferax sp.]